MSAPSAKSSSSLADQNLSTTHKSDTIWIEFSFPAPEYQSGFETDLGLVRMNFIEVLPFPTNEHINNIV